MCADGGLACSSLATVRTSALVFMKRQLREHQCLATNAAKSFRTQKDSQEDGSLVLLPRTQSRPHPLGELFRRAHCATLLSAILAFADRSVCVHTDIRIAAQGRHGLVDVVPRSNVCSERRIALHVVRQRRQIRRLRGGHGVLWSMALAADCCIATATVLRCLTRLSRVRSSSWRNVGSSE